MATRANVKIRPNGGGTWAVEVDGHDLAPHIPLDGLKVDFVAETDGTRANVTVTLADVALDADLPDAVLSTLIADTGASA